MDRSAFFFVIVLAMMLVVTLVALAILNKVAQRVSQSEAEKTKLIESLTKLAAAKDVAAFHALEAPINAPVYTNEPMDDESVARRMMDMYSDRGIDPSLALSPDSDPLEDFGGTNALFGKSD